MQFLITRIELDFDGEDLHPEEKHDIISDIVGQAWQADDEEYLVDEISDATGWCVKSIDYCIILD
ncbi:MAG: hypothetical protein ACO20M_06040 [Methylophilaceae bacterium]